MAGPVLLLHGIPVTSTIWRAILPALETEGPIIAPDLLGLGNAPQPDIPYGPEEYFCWLEEEVLADVQEPITLILHDFGGLVGLNWAVRRPERVKRLVIMNTTAYPSGSAWSGLVKLPGLLSALLRLLFSRALFPWQMRTILGLKDERLIAEYAAIYTRPNEIRTVGRTARNWDPEVVARIATGFPLLQVPVLLLWGMQDRYSFPWHPHGERFLADFPGARVVQIPDAAHFVQAEQPETVIRHLRAFLAEPII